VKLRLATPLTVSGRVIVETIEGAPTPSAPSVLLIKQHGGQILYSEQAIFTAQAEEDGRILLPTCSNPADTAARLLPASQSATSGPRDVSCRTSNPCPEPHFSIAPRTLPPWVLLGPLPDQRRPPGRVGRGLSMRRCYRGPLAQASAPAKSRRWICPSPPRDEGSTVRAWRAAARARSCSHPSHKSRQTYRTKHSSACRQSLLPLLLGGRAKHPGRPRCSRS